MFYANGVYMYIRIADVLNSVCDNHGPVKSNRLHEALLNITQGLL